MAARGLRMPLSIAFGMGLAAGCQSTPQPIPVRGDPSSLSQLAGVWRGEYSSGITGRSGVIEFSLEAGQDTAFGEVVMFPEAQSGYQPELREGPTPDFPEALRVNFVRATEGGVEGSLARYTDPRCGCSLLTVFRGRVQGDMIDGDYESLHEQTGERVTGHWHVHRVSP